MRSCLETLRPVVLAGLALALAACGTVSGKPSRGDVMIARGESVADIGKRWNRGRDMVDRAHVMAAEGAKLKQRGQRSLEKGREQIAEGDAIIAEGRALKERGYALMRRAEYDFGATGAAPGAGGGQ